MSKWDDLGRKPTLFLETSISVTVSVLRSLSTCHTPPVCSPFGRTWHGLPRGFQGHELVTGDDLEGGRGEGPWMFFLGVKKSQQP